MRAAVVGGGVFGCTIAVELARAGARVQLFERHPEILYGASRANQGRLHLGYHYPRSPATAEACKQGAAEFQARFPASVFRAKRHHYGIAAYGRTSGLEFLDFCKAQGLAYELAKSPLAHRGSIELLLRVPEAFIDLRRLRSLLKAELRACGVKVHTATGVEPADLPHDLVVDATYGHSDGRVYQFEVCEIALIELGRHYRGQSFVIMDGPFVSLDPLGSRHMLYDVAHSVHATNVGTRPEIPKHLAGLVDRGVITTPHTNVDKMLATARRYLNGIGMPNYVGSLFTVRTLIPGLDATDERPTLVRQDGHLVSVLGGKLDTAVSAARQVLELASVPV